MRSKSLPSTILCAALAATLAAGCAAGAPTAAVGRQAERPRAADVLAPAATATASGLGSLTPLVPGGPVTVPPGRGAVLALATGATRPGATLAVTDAPSGEAALRAWERRFRGVTPSPKYSLQAEPLVAVGDRRSYWVIAKADEDGVVERPVEARAVYVSDRCEVMVDVRAAGSLDAEAASMGRAFDDRLYPTDVKVFGAPVTRGVDADGRITLLVSPEVGDRGREGTLGYFTLRDLFSQADDPDEPALARSNGRLMLYVSSGLVARGARADVEGTLAHEFEHLINATRKLFGPARARAPEATWLDEGLAMYAMQANGFGLGGDAAVLTEHVAAFLAHPERYSLTDWEAGAQGSAYGLAYLFVAHLAERFGESALATLVDSPARGEANIEALARAHGTTLDALFRDFGAAVLLDGQAGEGPGFRAFDLRGASAGARLRGPALTTVAPGTELAGSVLPYSLRFLWVPASDDGRTLSFGGDAAAAAGGWMVAR